MKISFLISLVLSCFFISAYTGHIYSHDIVMSPNNINNPSAITFIFTLDTSVAATDYLRIVLPFKLNPITSAVWAPWSLDATTCTSTGTSNLAVVTDSTLASQEYFVQFYTDNTQTTLSGLTAGTAYYVTITGTIHASSQTGINLPVGLYTVSDILAATYIIYDSNPTFGTISLASDITTIPTMTVSTTIPSTETASSPVLGATYKVNVDITPKTTLKDRARIDIALTNTAFELLSCTSIASASDKITALTASYASLNTYTIRATVSSTLTAGNSAKYRFQCQIKNPLSPGTTKVNVQNRYGYIETISETGISSVNLQAANTASSGSSSAWSETNHQVQLGWGYPASSATALNIFSLYKDASAAEKWYQSTKTIFQPLASMTSTAQLQVRVSTVVDAGFQILVASIYHNLPSFDGQDITFDTTTQGILICNNVGQLQAQSYFISFKFNLLNTATATSVTDFGKVEVRTQSGGTILLPLSQTTLTNKAIATNVALFTGTNGIIASSTTSSGATSTTYVTNGEDIKLKLTFNYFMESVVTTSTLSTAVIDRGIEFYTSQALATPSTTVGCTIDTLSSSTDVLISDCAVSSQTSFTRLRFRLAQLKQTGAPVSTLFAASAQSGTIIFDKVQFSSTQFSSLNYVSIDTYDYYARWVQDFTALNPTIVTASGTSPFFFNSLVYKNGGLANVNVGTTFFATGASSSNDGTSFPTLIRITGYLTSGEQVGADRLLLFFNDLVPLNTEDPCFGPAGISCKYNENKIDNTATDSLTDYSGSRRIEITTDLTQRFNIYIPVSTVAGKSTLGFFIASAKAVSADASAQGIFSSMHSKRIAAVTSSQASWTVNPVGGTPALGVSGTPAMGSVSSPNINVPGGYVVPTANSGTSIGGAYGYCANYDFTIASGFQLQPYYTTTSTPEELCVALSYPSTSDTITCSVCPVHSTMSTGTVTTTSFTLPTMAGVDLYKLVYVVGSDNGDFLNAADDNQANVLSPLTLASTAISFSPLALNKDGKNVYAELKFTVVSALPKKIRINITPSSGTLKMTPIDTAATSVSCEPTTVSYTSCSASGTDTDIQLDVVANEEWGVAEHTIRFMVDSSGITADEDVNYGMTIMVDGVTALGVGVPGAIHHQTTSSFIYKVMGATTDFIVLSDISYLFGTQGARTIVKFGFELPETVFLYPSQKLKFNLGGIASANTGEEPGCVVRDAVTLEAVGDFSHCDTTSLTALTLTAKSGAKGAYILELSFVIVPNPGSVTGITCELIGVDGTTPVIATDPATPLALPTVSPWTIIPAANVQYSRLYADAGSVSEIKLTIKPTVLPIDVQSSVYVYFPKYYAGKLGYQNVWCTAGGLPLACTLLKQRVLQLTSFPVTAAVGAAVEIKIYGVITPVVPNIPGKIFIAIDKGDYFSLTEQIEISDTASNAATPGALTIDKFSVSTNLIREQADYTIVFTTDSSGIRAQKIISIDFPDRYGNILRGQTGPKISIRKTGDSVVTTVQSSSFGSRFKIVLPLNLDPSTSYTFVIKAIDNPETPMCIMDRPTISVATDATETSVSKRSASNIFNAAPISYYSDPNLKDLYWTDASGNVITSLTLSIGIFSAPIRIVPPTGTNFMNDITFSLSDNSISLLPETLTANRGSPYLSLRVAAPSSTYPGVTLLSLTKDESTTSNVYMQVAKLQLTLTNNNKTLPTPTLRIVKGGTSLPYKWEMDTLNMIPNSELKIQAAVTDPTNSALSIQGPSVLTFGPETPQLGFTFVLSASASAGSPPTFTLTLDGEDAANYIFPVYPTLITVDVLNPVATAPILTLTAPSVYTPTQQKLELTLDQMASVYWHVAYENQLTSTTCERVRAIYNEGTTYDASSSTQAQYGVFYVYLENIASPQIISNLLSKTVYSYILCPVNQLDNMGTATTGTFTTADNTARLDKVTISFSKPITRNQLTILVCLFNTQLQLPDRNVVAMDGTSCSQASVFDDFSSFDYQNVVIWINGDRASDLTSTTSTVLNQYITSVQDSTPSDFLTTFNSALRSASLTSLYKSITLAVGPTYSLPSASTSSLTVTANSTSIVVDGLRLSSAGVVYAIATTDLNNIPTSAQIQASLDYSGTTVPSANALYSTSSVSLTLTDLVPSTTYNIYYVGSTADRTQYARVTTVNYVQKATTKAQTVSAGRLEISLVLTSILALLAFLL